MPKMVRALASRLDLIVLLVCLGLVFGVWQFGIRSDQLVVHRLEGEREEVEQELGVYLRHLFAYTHAVSGLYTSSDEVELNELSNFVKSLQLRDEYPEILRISFVQAVPTEDVPAFEAHFRGEQQRSDYVADVVEGEPTQFYVTQVVDRNGVLYVPSGQNLLSEARRRAMIRGVLKTGESAVTYVDSVGYIPEYSGDGFVLSTPFYHDGALRGLINIVLSREMVAQVVGGWVGPDVAWVWDVGHQDGIAQGGADLGAGRRREDVATKAMPGGEEWHIHLAIADRPSAYWNWVLGVGVAFSFMIYAMVYGLTSANVRAEVLAETKTREITEKTQFIEAVLANLPIGIAVNRISDGKATYMNKAFEQAYGWSRSDLTSVNDFFTRVYPDAVVREALRKRIAEDIGSGDLARMKWDDIEIITSTGEKRYVSARNIPLPNQDLMVSTVEDTTERKMRDVEEAKHAKELEDLNKLMVGWELKMVELKKEIEALKGVAPHD